MQSAQRDEEERRMTQDVGRVPSSRRLRDLGLINWVAAKIMARTVRAPEMHLFTTVGQHKRLLTSMMPYNAVLLRGRLPLVDTELVILRVAHLRDSEYELQHHRWMGRRRGLGDQTQALIFGWPNTTDLAGQLSDRQQTLLRATDEFILNRSISAEVWQRLAHHLDRRQLIEFCMLAGHYDCLAATLSSLQIPLDNPGDHK
jgi:alkylhydroperoxidase family enzyme